MAAMRGPRLQVGSTPWIAEERSSALQIAQSEVEEFSFSARNELEWLNEHMAGIFDENETNFTAAFKTPGKLRGKTPRTIRKAVALSDTRAPLSDVFTTTPNGAPPQQLSRLLSPKPIGRSSKTLAATAKPVPQSQTTQDSGYYGSQEIESASAPVYNDLRNSPQKPRVLHSIDSPAMGSPAQPPFMELSAKTFQTAREEQTRQLAKQAVFSDAKSSPFRHNLAKHAQSSSPLKQSPLESPILHSDGSENSAANGEEPVSASEASSPVRPVVRKSSLNFASLPAREPLAAGKNIGRVSRVSHLEKSSSSKSFGHTIKEATTEHQHCDDMEVDENDAPPRATAGETVSHSKTYTQRLQDQINQLGKSNTSAMAQARSYPNIPTAKKDRLPGSQSDPSLEATPGRKQSITKVLQTTPGAFPEDEDDDDDDWIEPPSAAPATELRPAFSKSYSADVMEGIQDKDSIGQPDFTTKSGHATRLQTHGKSVSVTTLPSMKSDVKDDLLLTKYPSASHLSTVAEAEGLESPFRSPSRLFRDSPLKQMKSKLSSILKGSRSLLASSAAISAEGKSSLLSPSTTRLGIYASPSSEAVALKTRITSQGSDVSLNAERSLSPAKTRRTRASTEREREEKRREKEAQLMAEQLDRLDKAREKEREKARVFSKEQERIAAMEKEIAAKKREEQMHSKQTPKAAQASSRKARSDEDNAQKVASQDVDMTDAPQIAPPSAARATSTTHSLRNRDVKRPVKPAKEDLRTKQAPTVIRVKPGSQHSQFHQVGRQSTNAQDHAGLSNSQHQLSGKASKASLHSKASTQSLKSSTNGRPKVTDAATKKKEAEEREAQKRRDAKAEMERKRIAAQEEQRVQEQRRADAERQKKELAEERKTAQRQAALEKAKQTKAPPPAARSQANGPPDFTISQQQKMESQGNRPVSRMMTGQQRQQAEPNSSKTGTKRPVGQENNEDAQDRRPPTRGGPAYQGKDAKRRRTSEAFQDEAETGSQHVKVPPVRPSPGFKNDMPPKSLFQNGYSNVPSTASHDLFKASVATQQLQGKAGRPVDMAQISKGNIPFAPNGNAAGPAFKTPARPGPFLAAKSAAKSVPRSSPQFQNGEAIDLPEIQTDDEDEEEDAGMNNIAGWAASPDLRMALMRQETMDPSQIFGPPAPLNMEEVFSKSKDRWHKFRARTSSANWSGPDGLTEDDIRKDMAAREKLRREGGWSYEMSKDML